MNVRLTLLLIGISLAIAARAQIDTFKIDSRHSEIGFSIGIAGGLSEVDGAFEKFDGMIIYDKKRLKNLHALLTIDANSINTGIAGRDNHLRDEDFFYTEKFPTIMFRSTEVLVEGNQYFLEGDLTMRGISRKILIKFERKHTEPSINIQGRETIIFLGQTTLNRKEFNIKSTPRWNEIIESTGERVMSDDVSIVLKIIAEKI